MASSRFSLISQVESNSERVHVAGIRCFTKPQSARLGKITVLVGENSTGKSTFLAVNSIMNKVLDPNEINFNREPFILGSYPDIATMETNGEGNREEFSMGLEGQLFPDTLPFNFHRLKSDGIQKLHRPEPYKVQTKFINKSGQPAASETDIVIGIYKFTIDWIADSPPTIKSISIGSQIIEDMAVRRLEHYFNPRSVFSEFALEILEPERERLFGKESLTAAAIDALQNLWSSSVVMQDAIRRRRTYAIAPVRSTPKRTYDPVQSLPIPEGRHVAMMLSQAFREDRDEWFRIKRKLEDFGEQAGLFREISVRPLGESASDPFQLTVTVRDNAVNLLDVGYGVSQILPILVDTLTQSGTNLFLLQQPEVHLHPRGQAALATFLLDQTQDSNRRFIVETHSDQMIDRLRIEIRDRKLDPQILSLLYFEQDGDGVTIREIELDDQGNLTNAPSSYREFFLNEEYSLLDIRR